MRITQSLAGLFCLSLLGCAVDMDEGVDVATEDLTLYPAPGWSQHWLIKPSDTALPGYGAIGAAATWGGTWAPNRDHYVYRPAVSQFVVTGSVPPNQLVVFFPGCGGQPFQYQDFMETALAQGYHVIGLDYPNACNLTCVDLACFGDFRQEVSFGDDTSDDVLLENHRQDAINKRLKALLLELEGRDPYGRWDLFLDQDPTAPDGLRLHYSRIVFAGHSLGAGYAAYFGHKASVSRVVMISSPADAVDDCTGLSDPTCRDTSPTSAPWLAQHQTASSLYFGLAHSQDFGVVNRVNRIIANWSSIGVPSAQQVVSTVACTGTCSPHSSVAGDVATYGATWVTMLGSP